ncbi:metallophosphoesterase family protein [Uliginosibacterium aquaticum]|uniref:Metallophosphoesterase n=1 Tax=Uliginosibacterium aquaticum TaxID=2731212 RepID=A0ABX2IHN1_9RHOO|nr:metallophosphoesterase [Uliginosibacterium aquaticum]NSL56298.1 metallophosphoesterase [Uliginosibacterium aquaticum]
MRPLCLLIALLLPLTSVAAEVPLIVVGDIAQCDNKPAAESAAARTAALAARIPGAWVALTGDLTYPLGTAQEYADCFEPTWGRFRRRSLPAPGNHDYGTGKADAYFDYFGRIAGPQRRGYYSRKLGGWHIVSLNSELKDEEARSQLDWLRQDLAANRSRCLLALWHRPVFSSGPHGNDASMLAALPLLEAAGADLVLSGHDHHYERFARLDTKGRPVSRGGIRHFVVGTGGAGLYPEGTQQAGSEARIYGQHGVLLLRLKPASYRWAFMSVGDQAPLDAGMDNCRAKR